MGKHTKAFSSLPTSKLRAKAWARHVRFTLHDTENEWDRPYAHLIDELIKIKIKALKEPLKSTLNYRMTENGKEFVSRGRWMSWWEGSKPNPVKIDTINFIVPNSKEWFESSPSTDPVRNFLYAIDLWAGETYASNQSISLLLRINDEWRPKLITEGTTTWTMTKGWRIFKDQITSEIAINHFRPLEPSSIIESMIWVGHFLDITKKDLFLKWIFDLMAAVIATKSFIAWSDYDMNSFEGSANDIGSMLMDIFINKNEKFIASNNTNKWVRSRCALIENCIPIDHKFYDLILSAEEKFRTELDHLGIEIMDIVSLDPWKMQFTRIERNFFSDEDI